MVAADDDVYQPLSMASLITCRTGILAEAQVGQILTVM